MLRLTLLCHGATSATRAAAFPRGGEPLEPGTLEAARDLGSHFRGTRAITSPAVGARQTAEALGVPAAVDVSLRDCDYGRWAGRDLRAVAEAEPEAFAAFLANPDARPHDGESLAELCDRTAAWLETLIRERGRILAVTHASIIRAALLAALSAPFDAFWRIDVMPLSTIELLSDSRRWVWRAAREAPRAAPAEPN